MGPRAAPLSTPLLVLSCNALAPCYHRINISLEVKGSILATLHLIHIEYSITGRQCISEIANTRNTALIVLRLFIMHGILLSTQKMINSYMFGEEEDVHSLCYTVPFKIKMFKYSKSAQAGMVFTIKDFVGPGFDLANDNIKYCKYQIMTCMRH